MTIEGIKQMCLTVTLCMENFKYWKRRLFRPTCVGFLHVLNRSHLGEKRLMHCKKSNYRAGEFLNILGRFSEKLGFGLNFRKRPE
jgi:hypothetical protein